MSKMKRKVDGETARPPLVAPRQLQTIEAVRAVAAGGAFDPDVWHVMDERDNALIADEILHGPGSSKFVYQFDIAGQRDPVSGISVIGARHLAAHYKGLKHRLVAAMQKTGSSFVFTSYPSADQPMAVTASSVPELADEEDFYSAVVEMTDIKTGNSIQMERREPRYGERQGGGHFERPHYATIAQSKAYRNAVLALIPQDIAIRWKMDKLWCRGKRRSSPRACSTRNGRTCCSSPSCPGDRARPSGDRAPDPRSDRRAWRRRARGTYCRPLSRRHGPSGSVSPESSPRRRESPPRRRQPAAPAESANRRREAATVAPAQTTAVSGPQSGRRSRSICPREDVVSEQQPPSRGRAADATDRATRTTAPRQFRGVR